VSVAEDSTMRKALVGATVVVALAIALAFLAEVWIAKSDAFATTESFIRQSPEVGAFVGAVKDVSISSSGESMINNYGDDGNATLSVDIGGANAKAIAQVHLIRKLRVWQVATADVRRIDNNRLISLSGPKGSGSNGTGLKGSN
jgi:hypothetical protein